MSLVGQDAWGALEKARLSASLSERRPLGDHQGARYAGRAGHVAHRHLAFLYGPRTPAD